MNSERSRTSARLLPKLRPMRGLPTLLLPTLLCTALGCIGAMDARTTLDRDIAVPVPRPNSCNPMLYLQGQTPPANCSKIGEIRVRDAGWTEQCTEKDVLGRIRTEICHAGADAARVVSSVDDDGVCPTVTADLLSCPSSKPEVAG